MPKTSFVLGAPIVEHVAKPCALWFINWLTCKYMEVFPDSDYPPVILSVVEIPDSCMVSITYALRYEVK